MAKSWSGFLPLNIGAQEDWALLEGCETEIRKKAELLEMEAKAHFRTEHPETTESDCQSSR